MEKRIRLLNEWIDFTGFHPKTLGKIRGCIGIATTLIGLGFDVASHIIRRNRA